MSSQTGHVPSQLPGSAGTTPAGQAAATPQSKCLMFIDNLQLSSVHLAVRQRLKGP